MHTPMFTPFAAHLSLRVNHSYLNEPTPALWVGISSFTFSHHGALFVSFLPSLDTSSFSPSPPYLTYILTWSTSPIFQDVQEKNLTKMAVSALPLLSCATLFLSLPICIMMKSSNRWPPRAFLLVKFYNFIIFSNGKGFKTITLITMSLCPQYLVQYWEVGGCLINICLLSEGFTPSLICGMSVSNITFPRTNVVKWKMCILHNSRCQR